MEVGGGSLVENEHKDIVILGGEKYTVQVAHSLLECAKLTVAKPKFGEGSVTVVGDAMYAMGPFIAQGGNASLEDAVVFARCFADIGIRNSGLMTMLPY
ncbi:hypothetical protein RHSIM_Rhsim07G0130300 [Rhododendron simsii]|uniref:Uncharacterized protein n=1 Tax=Rhododendron simsii TaxID=118357 RepID=A0A834GPZ9_RHOSS|nr:hypothetical protein RHSIM_Rhsim07G0130300 [Rhododendron simsii]